METKVTKAEHAILIVSGIPMAIAQESTNVMQAQSSRGAVATAELKLECVRQMENGRIGEAVKAKAYAAQILQKPKHALIMEEQARKQEHAHNIAHGCLSGSVFSHRNAHQEILTQETAANAEPKQEYAIHKDYGIISAPAQEKVFAIQAQLKQGHAAMAVRNIELAKISASGFHGAIVQVKGNAHQEIQNPKIAETAAHKAEYAKATACGVRTAYVRMKGNALQE